MSDHPPQIDPEAPPVVSPTVGFDRLVIYGDFSCPFSALAFRRATRYAQAASVPFEWRAVEHAPEVPVEGVLLDDAARAEFARELAIIRELLTDDEADDQLIPTVRLNTARLSALHASLPPARRLEFAAAAFDAYWRDGRDLNDPAEVERFEVTATDDGKLEAQGWQHDWEEFERRTVPMLRLADGQFSRGLGALKRLQ